MFTKTTKPPKKTLDDLLSSKKVITGKEVIHKSLSNFKLAFELVLIAQLT